MDKEIANLEDLSLQSIELFNFRNYNHLLLDNIGPLSLFIGENAVGKTNIIEAIQLVTELKSFRTSHVSELIQWGNSESALKAIIQNKIRQLTLSLHIEGNKREYFFNSKKRRVQDLKGILPAVSFSPDDLLLIKGSHSQRRENIDNAGTQLSKNFFTTKSDYLRLLKQKNQALKDELSQSFIESINDVLVKVGAQYIVHRLTYIRNLEPFLQDCYRDICISKEQLSIVYRLSWEEEPYLVNTLPSKKDIEDVFREQLNENIKEEIIRKRSIIGPHSDKIDYFLDEKNASLFASQGQQRSIVLALKMAELHVIQQLANQKPILLLDDVMSELDEKRRNSFASLIEGKIQTFITTTNYNYFSESFLQNAQIYELPFTT